MPRVTSLYAFAGILDQYDSDDCAEECDDCLPTHELWRICNEEALQLLLRSGTIQSNWVLQDHNTPKQKQVFYYGPSPSVI